MRSFVLAAVVLVGNAFASSTGFAQTLPGVTPTEIRIGHTAPYTGPASAYAVLGKTIAAYFEMINDQGGINGRRISFISYDDAGSPPRTVEAVRTLVERDDVLLLFQSVGTAQNLAVREYLNDAGIPQLFIATGATLFDDPANYPWTMRFSLGVDAEAAAMARHIVDVLPNATVGVLYQNDDFGRDILDSLTRAAAGRFTIVAQPYDLADATVDTQISALQAADVDALVLAATPRFASQAIRRSAEIDWRPALRLIVSSSSSLQGTYVPAGVENAVGIVTTVYLKNPADPAWAADPENLAFRAFLAEYYPEGDANGTFEAYAFAVAGAMVEVLRRAGDDLSRENVLRIATTLDGLAVPMLLPGVTLTTSPTDYAPVEGGQMGRFDGTATRRFGDVLDLTDGVLAAPGR